MSVSRGWPRPIRKAMEAAGDLVGRIDLLHTGLILAQPRHAQIVVENLAKLDHCLCCEGESAIPPVESALMDGRGNQAFRWPVLSTCGNERDVLRTRQFTSAHRAVMILAREMIQDVLRAMKPNVIVLPRLPDTDDEGAFKVAYLEVAESCNVIAGGEKAGPEWQSFRARYHDQVFPTVWPPSAAEDLVTTLQLEANAAAKKWPGPDSPGMGYPEDQAALQILYGGIGCKDASGQDVSVQVGGKTLDIIKALTDAYHQQLDWTKLRDRVWGDQAYTDKATIKNAIADARDVLRKLARQAGRQVAKNYDPLPCINRGKDLAWKLTFLTIGLRSPPL